MKIKVSRDKGNFGRIRKLKLYVDDEHLFDIKAGEAMIIDIPPNAKTIHGKLGWPGLETNLLSLENIGAGEQIKIEDGAKASSVQIDGRRSVASILRSVVLPAPLRPKKPTAPPDDISNETGPSALFSPKYFLTLVS